ncbi:uncharacterized protein LOC105256063 isoform X2 [Camponotus floridanus]|uniref:uncharacterized protein LOC105256063 isoform X2 n=1 Tax=Camponotus floridanus TaxID=104421 RepID=UPI00059B9638|nr:uncharacterized protein LOC105256063 isoform X2 [Camponotus floridanus]
MSTRRRRADDFTDSLTSFRQTTFEERQNSIASQKDLDDNSDVNSIRNKQYESDKHSHLNESCVGSIIIADEQLSKDHHTSEEYSNKIDSMFSEIKVSRDIESQHLNKKTVEIQCNLIRDRVYAMSLNSLEDTIIATKDQDVINNRLQRSKSCSILNSNLKRDKNHNIKTNYFYIKPINTITRKNSHEKIDTVTLFDALSLSQTSTLSNKNFHLLEKDQNCNSTSSETSSKEQFNNSFELKTFLQSLEQKPLEEAPVQEPLLRRMSANFYNSPQTFTERLLTIIEESIINDDSCAQEYPNVSLCRLTEELRKMCKFIEDETIPNWPQSPQRMSICMRQRSQGLKSPFQKSLDTFISRDKGLTTPTRRNIKSPKKTCQYMPKNISYNAKGPLHDSTSTFESLEAFCEKFYADECKTVPIKEKNPSQPPLQNLDSILHECENQMASLESSFDIREQLKKAAMFTLDLTSQYKVPEAQNLQSRLFTHEKHNKDSKNVPDTFKQLTRHNKSYEMIEPDDLENTLMYEIAKKRQRCLDTAKVMMEIDTNSESAKQICPEIVINESSSTSDIKFIETLMSVKRYQEYLEKHKSVLNLFRTGSSNSHIPDKKDVQTKEMPGEDFGFRHLGGKIENTILGVPKFSPMKCSTSKMVSKPKLFVTPGKKPIKREPKRIYFTSPNLVMGMNKKKNVSPHPKSIYQQIENYDHVVSPIGMYIKGTDPQLIKNLRPKTPKKKQMRSPSPKPKVKFRQSPKQPKETMTRTVVGDENTPDNFLHPKVCYKLPSHVRTIKETKNQKVGNRINELLRSTKDKVVIRHEGRIKSVQTDYLKQPEIHYDSAEESVHIEQTARKTCFSRIQKN